MVFLFLLLGFICLIVVTTVLPEFIEWLISEPPADDVTVKWVPNPKFIPISPEHINLSVGCHWVKCTRQKGGGYMALTDGNINDPSSCKCVICGHAASTPVCIAGGMRIA